MRGPILCHRRELRYRLLIMSVVTEASRAKTILGDAFIGCEEIEAVFGRIEPAPALAVPFSVGELEAAKQAGDLLIARPTSGGDGPITLRWLIGRFPDAFDAQFLEKAGYALRTDWGIALEPLAATETCSPGWALVARAILDASRNQNRDEQDEWLVRHAADRHLGGRVRRRSATEAAFDLIAWHRLRGERLLLRDWDWTSSRTLDGGYLNVGHFDDGGMQILSFSEGVRHGALGVCPTVDPAR